MIVKYYKDDGTLLREITIDAEEEKALSTAMADIVEWHQNFLKHRARQEIDRVVEAALRPDSTMLTDQDKQKLRQYLDEHGIVVASPRDLPIQIKKAIVKRAKVEQITG